MTEILLSSEKFIKGNSNISDNVAGKYILAALRQAQEVHLRALLGDCLLEALKGKVADGTLADQYQALVDRSQYFLMHQTCAIVGNMVTYKVGNFGVAKSSDENLQPVTQDEVAKQQFFYQSMADAEAIRVQRFVWENKGAFPELTSCDCSRIQRALGVTTDIFLGGPRGKILPGGGGCCK